MARRAAAVDIDEERAEKLGEQVLERIGSDPQQRYDELTGYMLGLKRYPVLTDQVAFETLYAEHRTGPDEKRRTRARDLIVYGNIRLVLSVALRKTGRGLPLLDMMQEGVIGLMHALEKFELDHEARFSTYAIWWIRQAISRALQDANDYRPMRVPVHFQESMRLVQRHLYMCFQKTGRWPSDLELFKAIRASGSKAAETLKLRDLIKLRKALEQGFKGRSIDAPIGDDEHGDTFGDILPDNRTNQETLVEAGRMLAQYRKALARIEQAIGELPPRDSMILRLRFGLGEFEAMTLEETAERYGITRERVRQIQDKAIETLGTQLGVTAEQIIEISNVVEELTRIVTSV